MAKQLTSAYTKAIKKTQKGIDSSVQYIDKIADFIKIIDTRVVPDSEKVVDTFDLLIHMAFVTTDLSIGTKHIYKSNLSKNQFEGKYFARIMAINCYELFNNINTKIGIELKKYDNIEEKKIIGNIRSEIKKLNLLKKKHEKQLRLIRNNIIAHRECKGMSEYEKMSEIDTNEILEISVLVHEIYVSINGQLITLVDTLLRP